MGARQSLTSSGSITIGRLACAIEQLDAQAEAMTAVRGRRNRHHRRGGPSWTPVDESVDVCCLADLFLARAATVGALLRDVARDSR